MHGPFSFGARVLLLLALMSAVVLIDFARNRANASKHKEYAFVLFAGIVGGLVGFVNDVVTSGISPDYFVFGKGLAAGENLRLAAGWYGLKAGFAAGIVGGAVCLFASVKKSGSTAELRRLAGTIWMPLTGAVLLGLMLPVIAGESDPGHLAAKLDGLLNGEQISRFRHVWWIHIGLYSGMTIGLVAMIVRHRRREGSLAR
jgi:hypothetical protein